MEFKKNQTGSSLSGLQILDQIENIFLETQEEVEIENRFETEIEVSENTKCEQELINLIDRLRNTENEISVMLHSSIFPIVTGEVLFTSDKYLVLRKRLSHYFINLSQIIYLIGVDQKAIFQTKDIFINTTTIWLKNLVDSYATINIYLVNNMHIQGKLVRFNQDHIDLQMNQSKYLIPLSAIVLIRCNYET